MKISSILRIGVGALRSFALLLTVFAVTLAFVLTGLRHASEEIWAEGPRAAEEAVRRAALCGYVLDGAYPPSYAALCEQLDPDISDRLFSVHYTAVAPNLMPEITVARQSAST